MREITNFFGRPVAARLVEGFEGIDDNRFYYPGGSPRGGSNGVILRFKTDGTASWTGVFGFGRFGHTGVYTHPNGTDIVVVSRGDGYVVDPMSNSTVREIPLIPILEVTALIEEKLLFLHDFRRIICIDIHGLRWRLDFDLTDEMYFHGQIENNLLVKVWFPNLQRFEMARIDVETGDCLNLDRSLIAARKMHPKWQE